MFYTINRIDTGKPACDQHGEASEQTPKTYSTRDEAQRNADAWNATSHTWMVVPHAEGSSTSMEAQHG